MMDFLKNVFKGFDKPDILDIATGTGAFLYMLGEFIPEFGRTVGIDSHQKIVGHAQKIAQDREPKIEFVTGDATAIDYPDNSFDIVTVANSLHHFPEPDVVLKEMWRVLRPDGLLLVMEMISDFNDPAAKSHLLVHHLSAEMDREIGRYHRETYTKLELSNIVKSSVGAEPSTHLHIWETAPESQADDSIDLLNNRFASMLDRMGDRKREFEQKRDRIVEHIRKHGFQACPSLFIWASK